MKDPDRPAPPPGSGPGPLPAAEGAEALEEIPVDRGYLLGILEKLLRIPSPSGYTDHIVHFVGEELERLGIDSEVTRRGAIRAGLRGRESRPARSLVAHLDTLGAMVKGVKPNGRLRLVPIGTWSARFAEGARVTVFTEQGSHRGSILPLLASGHIHDSAVDRQPVGWDQVELRLDERVETAEAVRSLGIDVGDYVAVDSVPELTETGFINSRHLDNKAGVSVLLAATESLVRAGVTVPVDCSLLFTIFEEVGSGASSILHGDVAEMVSVDNATNGAGQNSSDYGVTLCMQDSEGPFDYHLTHKLISICRENGIEYTRDVFAHYRCDAAAAIEAGNDIRTALICYALHGSHGYERTHVDSLIALVRLVQLYMRSQPTFRRDREEMSPLEGFSDQPM